MAGGDERPKRRLSSDVVPHYEVISIHNLFHFRLGSRHLS
jgi:hypothetical protein